MVGVKWIEANRMYVEKGKNRKRYMFGDLFIVPTCFYFNVLSEYKNILWNFFLYEK